jgi:hypothetical protein
VTTRGKDLSGSGVDRPIFYLSCSIINIQSVILALTLYSLSSLFLPLEMSQYILYDLPSKGRCACWSLNPWKGRFVRKCKKIHLPILYIARLALNFKGVDYKTIWLEYPDVAPTLSPQFGFHLLNFAPSLTVPAYPPIHLQPVHAHILSQPSNSQTGPT